MAPTQQTLLGRDVTNHWAMIQEPTMREYLLTVSTKPATRGPAPSRVEDVAWQATVVDPELHWQQALPSDLAPTVSAEGEQMLTVLQRDIDLRDALLADARRRCRHRLSGSGPARQKSPGAINCCVTPSGRPSTKSNCVMRC